MSIDTITNEERLLKYKTLAVAFSYPDEQFFAHFPQLSSQKETLQATYDRLFRSRGVWLYGLEHLCENEFQRAQGLADINGFYRAFGVEPDKERPDAIPMELEFLHYLILKQMRAHDAQQALICFDAQRKFFSEHLYPAASKIAENILTQTQECFYSETALSLREFLASESALFTQKQ
jgi:nitrate reductase assembly molybdenum cofactor insertion protein NarJ